MKQTCRGVGIFPRADFGGGLEDENRRQGRSQEISVDQAQ